MGKSQQVEIDVFVEPVFRDVRQRLETVKRLTPKGVHFTLVPDVIGLYGSNGRGFDDEHDLVQYALDVANGVTKRASRRADIRVGRAEVLDNEGRALPMTAEESARADAAGFESARARWREFLAGVLSNRRRVAEQFLDANTTPLERVWTLPTIERTAKGFALRHHPIIFDRAAFDSFVQMLILDEARPFGVDLRRCALESCGNYFLRERSKKGGRPRVTCSDPCTETLHNKASAGRKRGELKTAPRGTRKHK